MSEGKQAKLVYVLAVKGVFGRNRTVKFQTFRLAEVDRNNPRDYSELKPLVESKLADIKLKSGYVSLSEDPIEVDTYTDSQGKPVRIETHMIFSGRKMWEVRNYPAQRCAGCGEEYPCSDAKRTDISGLERAKHHIM